jgi:hypothetical protein
MLLSMVDERKMQSGFPLSEDLNVIGGGGEA